jgi:hypothetical protein
VALVDALLGRGGSQARTRAADARLLERRRVR